MIPAPTIDTEVPLTVAIEPSVMLYTKLDVLLEVADSSKLASPNTFDTSLKVILGSPLVISKSASVKVIL